MTEEHEKIIDAIKEKISLGPASIQSAITWFDNLFIVGEALRQSRKFLKKMSIRRTEDK